MANQMLYKSVTASTQVSTTECYIMGIEISGNGGKVTVYDETDSSKTAAKIVSTIKGSAYYHYNNIIFPENGVKCEGIYVYHDSGTATIYYRLAGDKIGKDILYSSITADALVTGLSCHYVGAEIIEGTMAIYDEPNSDTTTECLISTMKVGSHRHYKSTILSNPLKCTGLYTDVTDGLGTIYYYL